VAVLACLKAVVTSSSLPHLRMPLPPPPQEALSMMGYPILLPQAIASSTLWMHACKLKESLHCRQKDTDAISPVLINPGLQPPGAIISGNALIRAALNAMLVSGGSAAV